MNNSEFENLHCVMDERDRPYAEGECSYEFGLKDDLMFIQTCHECNFEIDPNSELGKLELEIAKCGLEITSETDIEQLAATVKLLSLV